MWILSENSFNIIIICVFLRLKPYIRILIQTSNLNQINTIKFIEKYPRLSVFIGLWYFINDLNIENWAEDLAKNVSKSQILLEEIEYQNEEISESSKSQKESSTNSIGKFKGKNKKEGKCSEPNHNLDTLVIPVFKAKDMKNKIIKYN